jgi:nicotinamidase-related amidase
MSSYRSDPLRRAISAAADRVASRLMRSRLGYPSAETALIVVDAQNDLLSNDAPGSDLVAGGVDRTNRLAALGHLVTELRTLGIRIAFANHGPITDGANRPLTAHQRIVAQRNLFAVGTEGAELVSPLLAQPHDLIVTPHTGLSAFTGTDLAEQLDAAGIERVIVAGALTETTLDATARSAVERGMQVTVASDACIGTTTAANNTHLKMTLPRIVHAVLDSKEVLRRVGLEAHSNTAT